tara:strand:- start:214 stop:444 length:231 start_codon:yes stop_codon:yes gene_type:complete
MNEIEVCENCYSCNITIAKQPNSKYPNEEYVQCNDCKNISIWSLVRYVEKQCVNCKEDSDYRTAHEYDEWSDQLSY